MHTQRTWTVEDRYDLRGNPCGWSIVERVLGKRQIPVRSTVIANTPDGRTEEQKKNAHLIAAAPELLEACNKLLMVAESYADLGNEHYEWTVEAISVAREAITKATLEEP